MLSCTDNRNDKTPKPTNEVIFRNVRPRYKFQNKISVLYVLSPKTKTSTRDYVGIYPRGWKQLREFVGFERPIPAPFEEQSLDRCIQFICQRPHVMASLNRDYQFLYVNQYHEVLGMSDFFQFVEEVTSNSPESSAGWKESKMCEENDSEWHEENSPTAIFENLRQHVSEAEYAYNTCYFVNNQAKANQEVTVSPNVGYGCLDEATNPCYVMPIESSECRFSSDEPSYQNSRILPEPYNKPRKGRPLVKTRDGGYREYQNAPDSTPMSHQTYSKNRCIGPPQDVALSPKWMPGSTWHYQPKHSSITQMSQFPGRKDTKRGAIPKQCPKCHVPSDYYYQQQIKQHDLDQAHEQIRDLNTTVDQLQHELQLSYAAQAKLKAVAEIARTESKNALSFLNSRMLSTIAQYKTKVVNVDNTMMYVTRDLESPGWFAAGDPSKTFLFGRPPNVRVVSGREKELKAIIGRQEMTIRKLYNDLKLATSIIECANLSNNSSDYKETEKDFKSLQFSCYVEGGSSGLMKDDCTINSTFDASNDTKVKKSMENGMEMHPQPEENKQANAKSDETLCPSPIEPESSKSLSEKGKESSNDSSHVSVVEPSYYQLDPMQFLNREVIFDDDKLSIPSENEDHVPLTMNETNNNNYDTKNLNSDEEGGKSKCTVCESTSGSSHDSISAENSN
ncbi:uncharacterized protein LOC117641276 isoform X2 [Thrips palmi]|uniref:Uncharacterized protein LOC117641276 isoform X2 n=1 Tax=Thrips palmi TaxID=161013 RepID=A0A6P8YK72_THRPL|nr:uncharacterized protein LOC117641276 isoform X2 [Thrips palmi]